VSPILDWRRLFPLFAALWARLPLEGLIVWAVPMGGLYLVGWLIGAVGRLAIGGTKASRSQVPERHNSPHHRNYVFDEPAS